QGSAGEKNRRQVGPRCIDGGGQARGPRTNDANLHPFCQSSLRGRRKVASITAMDLALLEKVPLFSGLSPPQLRQVAAIAQAHHYDSGTFVFKEVDPGHVRPVVAA